MDRTGELAGKRRAVAVQSLAALAIAVATLIAAPRLIPDMPLRAVAALCVGAPALALVIAIGRLAQQRFGHAGDIDAAAGAEPSARARILQAMVQNTLEQAVLAWAAYALLLMEGGAHNFARAASGAGLFAIGRVLFFIGYAHGARGRALGFALTFHPTVLLLAWGLLAALF